MISLWGRKEGPEYETKNYGFFSPRPHMFSFCMYEFSYSNSQRWGSYFEIIALEPSNYFT